MKKGLALVIATLILVVDITSTYTVASSEICPQNCSADIVLLIDRSGTMAAEFRDGSSKYDVAVEGVVEFLNSTCTDGRFWIGIIEFWFHSDNITYDGTPSNGVLFNVSSGSVVEDLISRLKARTIIPPVGLSMMGYGIGNATKMLSTGRDGVSDYIIIVSDGLTNQDPWDQVNYAKSKGIKIVSVFIGNPVIDDDELLANISDVFINVSDPNTDIGGVFRSLYSEICPIRTPVLVGGLILDNGNGGNKPGTAVRVASTIIIVSTLMIISYIIYRSNSRRI